MSTILDDCETLVSHSIRCSCLMVFSTMNEWLEHKKKFNHVKGRHFVAIHTFDDEFLVQIK
jgi:hypothetical protein